MQDDLVKRILDRIHDAPIPSEQLLDEAADRITALEAEVATARRDALEEAARVEEGISYKANPRLGQAIVRHTAKAIRALSEKKDG